MSSNTTNDIGPIFAEKKIDSETLEVMRARGGAWAAYQNQALDSWSTGHIQYLKIGEECVYDCPPERYPADTLHGLGWKYRFIGMVDFDTGIII